MVREKVKNNAPWFIYNFQDLIDELGQASVAQKKTHQQEEQAEEMFKVSESDSLSNGPMHVEEIGVKAS